MAVSGLAGAKDSDDDQDQLFGDLFGDHSSNTPVHGGAGADPRHYIYFDFKQYMCVLICTLTFYV
jgi:hypothetical protein